jgi:hypothetical protein
MFNKYNYMGMKYGFRMPSTKKRKTQKCGCGIMTFDEEGECALCKVEARFTALILKGVPMSRFSILRPLVRRSC